MARLIEGGASLADMLTFGLPNQANLDYCTPDPGVTPYQRGSNAFMDAAAKVRDNFLDGSVARMAMAIKSQAQAVLNPLTGIYHARTVPRLQTASTEMRPLIMAHPELRKIYHGGGCAGYDGEYVDLEPTAIGADHTDYQRVMNGVVTEDEDGDWSATTYLNNDMYEELSWSDQVDLLGTWETIDQALKGRSDPTSKWNGKI